MTPQGLPGRRAHRGAEAGARERILSSAVERIARDGIDEVRIARIAMDAGVSTSLVHYHFETREALLEQALEYSFELAGDVRIGEEEGAAPDHTQRLAAMVDQCLPYPGELERDWILWVELWLRAVRHPELRPTGARLYARMRSWLAEAIAERARAGEFDARRRPRAGRRPGAGAVRRLRRARAGGRAADRERSRGDLGRALAGARRRPGAAAVGAALMAEAQMIEVVQRALEDHDIDDTLVAVGEFFPRGHTGGMFVGGMLGGSLPGVAGDVGLAAGSLAGMHAADSASPLPERMLIGVSATAVYGFASRGRRREPSELAFRVPREGLDVEVHQRVNVRVVELIHDASGSRIELEGNRLPITHSKDVIEALRA